jgi:hypothetical protein
VVELKKSKMEELKAKKEKCHHNRVLRTTSSANSWRMREDSRTGLTNNANNTCSTIKSRHIEQCEREMTHYG